MTKRLSSLSTPIYKSVHWVVVPLGIIAWFRNLEHSDPKTILFLILFGAIWHLITRRWVNVYLEGGVLRVSKGPKTIRVPLVLVAQVKATSWWAGIPRRAVVTLRRRTEFGDKIIFVPRMLGYSTSETVAEIRALIKRARSYPYSYDTRAAYGHRGVSSV
jgi:hypothetical protein